MRLRVPLVLCLVALLQATDPISIALDKPVLSLDPLLLAREVEVQVVDLVFDRLVAIDEHGNYLPQMLESWEISKDGRDIAAETPARPHLAGRQPRGGRGCGGHLAHALPPGQVRKVFDLVGVRTLDSVVAEGPLTVRIRLKQARAAILDDLYNFQPVPRKLYRLGADPLKNPLNYRPRRLGPLPGAAWRQRPGDPPGAVVRVPGPNPGLWDQFRFRVQPADTGEYLRQIKAGEYHFADLDWFHHYLLRHGAFGAHGPSCPCPRPLPPTTPSG